MKKLLVPILLLFVTQVYSQQVKSKDGVIKLDSLQVERTEEYCMILGTQKFLSTKLTIQIDFGQERNFLTNTRLTDQNGAPIIFESMIDAINFMNGYGWEFVNAYVITVGNQNVYHWILKRRLIQPVK